MRGRYIGMAVCALVAACDGEKVPSTSAPSTIEPLPPIASAQEMSAPAAAIIPAARVAPMAIAHDPDVDASAWSTGDAIGKGVAFKEIDGAGGENAAIFYAGYGVPLEAAEAWASAFYRASLASRGVRYVWAVQGPADSLYRGRDLGNAELAASLVDKVSAATKFVAVLGHSSGSYVAHDLFAKLGHGADPSGVTDERIVYFDLDGGIDGFDAAMATRLRKTYFVAGYAADVATHSPNIGEMQGGAAIFKQEYVQHDASGAGCAYGAEWCVHVTLITTHPHDPNEAKPIDDYADFSGRSVTHAFFDAKADEAGLVR